MFNGYDSDVILEELKLAIHWNGPLHYRNIFGVEVFDHILHRDKLRYEAIENCGYTNYIIDDSNNKGFSKQKVDEEFNRFLQFIKDSGCGASHLTGRPH